MQEHNRAMRMFKAMDRMRKAWGKSGAIADQQIPDGNSAYPPSWGNGSDEGNRPGPI